MRGVIMQNKFGLFIHWGLYAIEGFHEHDMAKRQISVEEYAKLADRFNPTEYDPEEWVLMAKKAGMKYICFTTKHHDGFCMWDTKYTDFNVMNTPYGKDVLKMLADACKKHGMLLSLYYSCPDWRHPDAYNRLAGHQCTKMENKIGNYDNYIQYVKNQITELLSNYGEIYTLFWDIPPIIVDESVNALARSLQPNILINNRGFDKGDFATPEREFPDGDRFETMTEACQSVSIHAWGYRENDDFYPARVLMSSIDKVMAMDGSYLLNVGPMPSGKISDKAKAMVEKIGDWYNRMDGVLENTDPDPLFLRFMGETGPFIRNMKDGKMYFHFYNGLETTILVLASMHAIPRRARFLNSGKELAIEYGLLPTFGMNNLGVSNKMIYIRDINVDDYPDEPHVIEIEF